MTTTETTTTTTPTTTESRFRRLATAEGIPAGMSRLRASNVARCVRNVANQSTVAWEHRFDNRAFKPDRLRRDLPVIAPKIQAMLDNIAALDAKDMDLHGTRFKHFIFSDVRGSHGAKAVASALIAVGGFALAQRPINNRLVLSTAAGTPGNRFVILSGTAIFRLPVTQRMKAAIVGKEGVFNRRPDNVHGDLVRIVVADAGFKEGIDLFDVKYVHLLEPQMTQADYTQVTGRAVRMCGQAGLNFVPNEGWTVDVFQYSAIDPVTDIDVHDVVVRFAGQDLAERLVANELMTLIKDVVAVDEAINRNMHNFKPGSGTGRKTPPSRRPADDRAERDDLARANAAFKDLFGETKHFLAEAEDSDEK